VPADAAWVIEPGTAAAFTTADCLPIILASERIHCAAAIHAGWRSLAAGIITSVANSEFSPQPGTLAGFKAWIGPAISAADYEVDTVTRRRFLDCDPALDEYFQPTSLGHYLADLQGIATYGLLANGVAPGDIAVCSTSTYQTANLHSARRDGPTSGRMATVVGLNHINLS
jgi:YfiH family protein